MSLCVCIASVQKDKQYNDSGSTMALQDDDGMFS